MTVIFEENDLLLLCSDGLTNKVSELELEETVTNAQSLEEKANSLIDKANHYGGEDNITLVLVQFTEESESR